ncbi:MAG: hypothetical protein IIZ45_06415 [Firmicutes bacterium]|nr:hypothetical protein [Bacillota bacterium]
MHNNLPYNRSDHGDFMENWLPHRDASDIWKIQGIFHESLVPEAVYSYRLSIYKVDYPLDSFYAVQYSLGDALKARSYSERIIVPRRPGKKAHIDFDFESMFCGDHAQILDTEKALVLRLRGNEFGIDLRIDKGSDSFWLGEGERVQMKVNQKLSRKGMFMGVMPQMHTFGRLMLEGMDMRVEGVSSIERTWGKMPLRSAKYHWENFYLFFDDGTEASLMTMPLISRKESLYIKEDGEPASVGDFVLEPVEFLEIDEWRFSSLWQLDMPSVGKGPFYLIPMIKNQFALPICRLLVGIYDKDGNRYGLGHAELMPGARNELDKIGLHMFKTNTASY